MNEFEQVHFTDFKLVIDDGGVDFDEDIAQDDHSLIDDAIDDLDEYREPDIYEEKHPWDVRCGLKLRFHPKYWMWAPHELQTDE